MAARVDEQLDVIVVGAGLSGIGAACRLRERCPWASVAVLEARERTGGTWDLFRYPGVRSDSDMHTLGYPFEPWRGAEAFADGGVILAYLRQTARRHGVEGWVRTGHRVIAARWSSSAGRWTVSVRRSDGEEVALSCRFLMLCCGYYRYDRGHEPPFEGAERFRGPVVHPQRWPAELDWAGRRVAVIGSGATAVTLVPALARAAAHVTMVQRSPSWVMSVPSTDPLAEWVARRLRGRAHGVLRARNTALMTGLYQLSRRRPAAVSRLLLADARRRLPPGYPVHLHFWPRYAPWDQRMCFVPDGDLFEAIASSRASVVTDCVRGFTERGVELGCGRELEADLVVTATGLELLALGGISLTVDAEPVALPERLVYRGMMLSGVPNLSISLGYINASWTLRSDLTALHVCRLLDKMRLRRAGHCVPVVGGAQVQRRPLMELTSGYVRRSVHELPAQGASAPWRMRQNPILDALSLRLGRVDDGTLRFMPPATASPVASRPPNRWPQALPPAIWRPAELLRAAAWRTPAAARVPYGVPNSARPA